MKEKNIRVEERKLGRENALGLAYDTLNLIEIDSRLKGKKRLSVLCHEICHKAFPEATESEILSAEKLFANVLWAQNYRWVDNKIK